MPAPATTNDFLQLARQSGLVDEKDLHAYLEARADALPDSPNELAAKMVRDGLLTPINLAVDVCNAVSLHSGLPVSVIDLDRGRAPYRVGVAPAGASYVFNASGQSIDLGGLLCLFDAEGPCANAVKDAQRTKTTPATRRTLSLVWGTRALPGRTARATAWYQDLLRQAGATVVPVPV